jgi:hypothetical protein
MSPCQAQVEWAGKGGQIQRRGAKYGGHARNESGHDIAGSVEEGGSCFGWIAAVLVPAGMDIRDIVASVVVALSGCLEK